jgi:hypothetical protein
VRRKQDISKKEEEVTKIKKGIKEGEEERISLETKEGRR